MAGVSEIVLERDGHDQPWGFRLQGGQDVGAPLSIQRVLVGTPSDGYLKRGDLLLKIGTTDVKNMTHQQAADLFTTTGNSIAITIKRAAKLVNSTAPNPNKFSKPVAGAKPIKQTNFTPQSSYHQTTHFPTPTETVPAESAPKSANLPSSPLPPMQRPPTSPMPPKLQSYNSPMHLYSTQNIAEVAQMNQMGQSPIPSMNRVITPNKPQTVTLNPSREYNPQESATWQALQETADVDMSNVNRYPVNPSLREHEAVFSAVYTAPKHPQKGEGFKPNPAAAAGTAPKPVSSPIPNPLSNQNAMPRSPVPSKNPLYNAGPVSPAPGSRPSSKADSRPYTPRQSNMTDLPVFETNSIGGRKRITQSASFNKLMMDILGV